MFKIIVLVGCLFFAGCNSGLVNNNIDDISPDSSIVEHLDTLVQYQIMFTPKTDSCSNTMNIMDLNWYPITSVTFGMLNKTAFICDSIILSHYHGNIQVLDTISPHGWPAVKDTVFLEL